MTNKASARAYSNMALIKYWGKRDETLILPANNNLSMTLNRFYTTTTVTFDSVHKKDILYINHKEANEKERVRVSRFLDHIRTLANTTDYAYVSSWNEMPTAAGFGSSASGFAALAAAASQALGLPCDNTSLSRLARQGSGSASRSIHGGFVEWRKGVGYDGMDSYAVPVAPRDYWDLALIVVPVATERKLVSSREGMRRCAATSPYYQGWLDSAERDFVAAKEALQAKDFTAFGKIIEANALKMHALTLSADPPFTYWQEDTLAVLREVETLREAGTSAYLTMDAGPNVAVLCESGNIQNVQEALYDLDGVGGTMVCRPGPGLTFLDDDG